MRRMTELVAVQQLLATGARRVLFGLGGAAAFRVSYSILDPAALRDASLRLRLLFATSCNDSCSMERTQAFRLGGYEKGGDVRGGMPLP